MLVMPDCVFSEHVVVGKWDFSLIGCFLDFLGGLGIMCRM